MPIKFEVQNIENAAGLGERRKYVQLTTRKARTTDELADLIAHSCSLTASDVKAVMEEICHYAVDDLSSGSRFYLPEIGYLSLKVGNTPEASLAHGKITGKDIYLRNINFKPEAKFFKEIQKNVSFEKSNYSSPNATYDKQTLWQKVEAYLSANTHITRRVMREQFGLSDHWAKLWLDRFVEEGRLKKETFGRQALYSMA